MASLVKMLDGEFVDQLVVDGGSPWALYGDAVFTRMRAVRGADGQRRLIAPRQHIERTLRAALHCGFDERAARDASAQWLGWIGDAVKKAVAGSGDVKNPYIHLAYGQSVPGGLMMHQNATTARVYSTHITVCDQPPLYGDGVYLHSNTTHARPRDRDTEYKTVGGYAKLVREKACTRREFREKCRVDVLDSRIESVMYERVDDGNPLVSEGASCNLGAFDRDGNLHLSGVHRFPGITEQIIAQLARKVMGVRVVPDLKMDHLRFGSIALGTAAGVTPVVWFDGVPVEEDHRIRRLQEIYAELCTGVDSAGDLVRMWTQVVEIK